MCLPPCRSCRRPSTPARRDRKSTRLNSSHLVISYAVFCLKKKKPHHNRTAAPPPHPCPPPLHPATASATGRPPHHPLTGVLTVLLAPRRPAATLYTPRPPRT